jgi:hypothetical protein
VEKITYLEELGERVRTLHEQGLRPRQICRRLLGKEMQIAYITLGHFSGIRLVRAYLSTQTLASPSEEVVGGQVDEVG